METSVQEIMPALLDLSTIAETERAAIWSGTAPALFPGLSINHINAAPALGNIRTIDMGEGSLWSIQSPPVVVHYVPGADAGAANPYFSLLVQLEGETTLRQKSRGCALAKGDICLIDECLPFRMEGIGESEIVFLRMPRGSVLSRNPHLEHHTAIALQTAEAGTALLGDTLASALHTVPLMRDDQRSAVLTAIIHLLGAADTLSGDAAERLHWRVQAALTFIELNFALPGLSAEQVAQAQKISRRRLDQLLHEAIGMSITGQIWSRRLDQAAADLRDPLRASAAAAQIAFANGFEDSAHFTRAFKRRFGQSPAQWRHALASAI